MRNRRSDKRFPEPARDASQAVVENGLGFPGDAIGHAALGNKSDAAGDAIESIRVNTERNCGTDGVHEICRSRGGSKIGFRQIAGLIAEYANLQVHKVDTG